MGRDLTHASLIGLPQTSQWYQIKLSCRIADVDKCEFRPEGLGWKYWVLMQQPEWTIESFFLSINI